MAVVSNNLYYSYESVADTNYTLNGLNMNVPIGCIYGLLGPSGCGKTTLLKCLIGFLKPKFGNILVFGYEPGDARSGVPGGGVGYMPQELAIQYDLTIEEILIYFGTINSMEKEPLSNEIDFLVRILHLCDKRKLIGQLSGGQKRRVSLAIAMLHKPRLLILDEPTVGVDPMLSEVIWKLLLTLSSTLNTTIIITTHYIDEAKRANCVAFMRKGMILEEQNPKNLLRKYDSECLDDVFLKLCVQQKERKHSTARKSLEYNRTRESNIKSVKIAYQLVTKSHFRWFHEAMYAIVWKFLIETRRNPIALVLILFTTMSIIFAVKVVIGQTPRDLPVALVVGDTFVNHSHNWNNSFVSVEEIEENATTAFNLTSNSTSYTENLKTSPHIGDEYLYLPDIFKKSVDSKFVRLIEYSNFTSALRDAKKRIVLAIIYLKPNFSDSFLNCDPIFGNVDEYISDDTINNGSIHLYLDVVDLVIAETIRSVVYSSIKSLRMNIATFFNVSQHLLSSPVIVQPINFKEDRHLTSVEDLFSVTTFVTPGIVVYNSFALCIGLCIISFLIPVECDMSVREFTAGVKPVHTVLGQVAARFIFMFFNAIINLLAMVYILDVPCRGPIALIMLLMWMQMLLGLFTGLVMSSSMTNSYYSLYTAICITISLFASNGIIWGVDSQPYYFKWLMHYSPLYYSANTLRALLVYSNASVHLIWPGFVFTAIWIFIAFFITIFVLSIKK